MVARQRAVQTLPTLMRALRKEIPKPPPSQQRLPSNLFQSFVRYTDDGFTVNGVAYEGSVLCVGNLITSWSPKKFTEITADR
ncbi:hypothetical protein RHGRI_019387 [Rhododendron griersonianum]|uniref:Uncharacterized protein n=1 Tax=Rhododendron griersonianum TaxID=479676 RepID=A0AAV6JG78_9ERIC|nr:hypothetical protein RHGRI_019387 [Rhododendron griersonianum]